MGNPFAGAGYFLEGLRLIFRPGLRRHVVIPLLINVALFAGLLWLGVSQFAGFLAWLMPDLPLWLQWLDNLLWVMFAIAALLILVFAFSLLANLIAAPFNGLLAEAVEYQLTGERPQAAADWKNVAGKLGVSLLDELRKLLYALGMAIPFLLLFIIPVINIIAPLAWLAFSAWMLTLEYADYPMGNHGLRADEQKLRLRKRRLTAMGFGGVVTFATMIPILNFLVMPAAVAGATVMWVRQYRDIN